MLQGCRVLVTGAGQGNGAAIAGGLAAMGAEVILTDIQETKTSDVARRIRACGGMATSLRMDVTDADGCAVVARQIAAERGPIDALINNAAILRQGTIEAEDFEAAWRDVMTVNLDGTMRPIRAFLSQLRETRGAVVNTASVAAWFSLGAFSGYAAAKAGVLALTRSLAKELAPDGIRVNAVVPGVFRTEMSHRMSAARRAYYMTNIAMERFGEPAEFVGPIAFLASRHASYVTGVSLPVDGGFSAT